MAEIYGLALNVDVGCIEEVSVVDGSVIVDSVVVDSIMDSAVDSVTDSVIVDSMADSVGTKSVGLTASEGTGKLSVAVGGNPGMITLLTSGKSIGSATGISSEGVCPYAGLTGTSVVSTLIEKKNR